MAQNELYRTWKEVERVGLVLAKRGAEKARQAQLTSPTTESTQETTPVVLSPGGWIPFSPDVDIHQASISVEPIWKERYEKIKEAYIKTRLEVSGSFGNWSSDTRRRVLENELSAELGFTI